jgi:hypothetical protein
MSGLIRIERFRGPGHDAILQYVPREAPTIPLRGAQTAVFTHDVPPNGQQSVRKTLHVLNHSSAKRQYLLNLTLGPSVQQFFI